MAHSDGSPGQGTRLVGQWPGEDMPTSRNPVSRTGILGAKGCGTACQADTAGPGARRHACRGHNTADASAPSSPRVVAGTAEKPRVSSRDHEQDFGSET